MAKNELSTEDKIFRTAYNIFLLYGFHGTTLQQIASEAKVNKSVIHYYFRSKERLYIKIVETVVALILKTDVKFISNRGKIKKPAWFIFTELYNNKFLFERTLKELYTNDYERKIYDIKKWLENVTIHNFNIWNN